jgi:hypothetical protein
MSNPFGFDFLKEEHLAANNDDYVNDDSPTKRKVRFAASEEEGGEDDGEDLDEDGRRRDRSDLEKQFDVIQFLQTHRSASRCFTPATIYEATGVDLSGDDENVAAMLARNPKVRIEEMVNPEYNESVLNDNNEQQQQLLLQPRIILAYGYQAKFNIQDKTGLLAQINRCKNGIRAKDLYDAYDGVIEDINSLVTGGEVISVANLENKDRTLFPRGEPFIVEMEGNINLVSLLPLQEVSPIKTDLDSSTTTTTTTTEDHHQEEKKQDPSSSPINTSTSNATPLLTDSKVVVSVIPSKEELLRLQARQEYRKRMQIENDHYVQSEVDLRRQVRRGEAVWVGGQWFRVSSAVRENVPLAEQPPRAQAPQSVTLRKELSKKNEIEGYVRTFTAEKVPLDAPLREESKTNLQLAKEARDYLQSLTGVKMRHNAHASWISGMISSSSGTSTTSPATTSTTTAGASSSGIIRKRPTKHLLTSHTTASSSNFGGTSGGGVSSSTAAATTASTNSGISAPPSLETIRQASSNPALAYSCARRHGCSTDIKEMYLATRADVPVDETDLYKLLVNYKLLDEGEAMRRPRMKRKTDAQANGKPKKRRYYERKNQRITNVHLVGTEMGAVLAQAAARQQQGKEVGDGGM